MEVQTLLEYQEKAHALARYPKWKLVVGSERQTLPDELQVNLGYPINGLGCKLLEIVIADDPGACLSALKGSLWYLAELHTLLSMPFELTAGRSGPDMTNATWKGNLTRTALDVLSYGRRIDGSLAGLSLEDRTSLDALVRRAMYELDWVADHQAGMSLLYLTSRQLEDAEELYGAKDSPAGA